MPEGTYSVVVTDSNGCIESSTVAINHPFAPLSLSDTSFAVNCFGGSDGAIDLSVSGGTSPYSYSWLPSGGASSTANNLSAGVYTLNVLDANQCSDVRTFTVTQPDILNISVTENNYLLSVSSLTGGTSPYSYSWSNGEIIQNISPVFSYYTLDEYSLEYRLSLYKKDC